jgi:hypothetical protein
MTGDVIWLALAAGRGCCRVILATRWFMEWSFNAVD